MGLRRQVLAGERAVGAMVFECFSPGVPQIMAQAGCEYVVYDMEHSGLSIETLKAQVAGCRGVIAPLARPPVGDYHFLARLLDIGMRGVMVPMVDSAEAAARVVEACRYPPVGRRGAAFGFAHDGYAPADPARVMHEANEEILVIAQIETERGLAEADAIAATPGVDVIWIGQFDLSNFLGTPGDFESPAFTAAWEEISAAARRHGKALGALAANKDLARAYAAEGVEMIAVGPDQAILRDGTAALAEAAR